MQYEIPMLSVKRNGFMQFIEGDLATRTIGVNFRICPRGVHVTSVTQGSPAQNCRDEAGNRYVIEVDDHILTIDGITPTSTTQVKDLIGNSRSDVRIRVLDKDGKTIHDLIVKPQ